MSRTVALSGELGSGKSSVSQLLADALEARRVSTGEAQRRIAAQRGISTLELNRLSETDPQIDEEIDSVFRSLADAGEDLVVDSRLAWHFLPAAFKVHLVVEPAEGARRVLDRRDASAERYSSLAEALEKIDDRVTSEQRRFLAVYGIDIFDLCNYDLVVDTTEASPGQVAAAVLDRLGGLPPGTYGPALLLAPGRLAGDDGDAPADVVLVAELQARGYDAMTPVDVVYRRPRFEVVDGRRQVAAAQAAGLPLIAAALVL